MVKNEELVLKKVIAKMDLKKIKEGYQVRLMYTTNKYVPIMFFEDKKKALKEAKLLLDVISKETDKGKNVDTIVSILNKKVQQIKKRELGK